MINLVNLLFHNDSCCCLKIKILSLIFEEVVDHIFECEKISIVTYVDTVQYVYTSVSLTLLFCDTNCHGALCDCTAMDCTLWPFILSNIYLLWNAVKLSALFIPIAKHPNKTVFARLE